MMNLGDVPAGSTLYVPFATYNSAGASVTITGLAVTDIEIYKNGSVTQRASDAGYALLDTDGIDFDGITGIHGFSIDLSDNTDAGFYAAGSVYWLVVSAITVDSQTVSFVYYFTIDKANVLRPTTAGRTLDVSATGEADANVVQWLGTAAATPTVAGVPEVDVTHWIGTAAATPTVAGVPEVDITHFGGSAGTFASGVPAVNATQISGDATAADNLETAFDDTAGAVPWMGIIDQGTAQSASATGVVLRSAAAFADDTLIGSTIAVFGSTQGYWQQRLITDNALTGDSVTVETWGVTPSGTITYKIFGTAPGSGAAGLDAAGVRAAIGMASANLDTQLSTIDTVVDAILVDTGTTLDGRIPAALVSGRMDASVGAMAANVLTATAINADAITAAKVAADVGTEIGAAVLAAAAADPIDANVEQINTVAITGNGQVGTEFSV